jgi:acetyl-CoA carboxylase carboxyltransferase component
MHADETGFADAVGESEEECLDLVRRLLAYLPSHADEPPPRAPVPPGSGGGVATIAQLLPEPRNRAYDMTRLIRCLVDGGEILPVKERFGRSLITALARIGGRAGGDRGNQPIHKAGACDADGCDKAVSFLALCDLQHPLVFLHDIPGFLHRADAERRRVSGKIIN